jgi:DNA-binding transcriptional LysR family regulator
MMRPTTARTEGLDLNLLAVLAAIRAEGSVTRAAARIGLTQAGASRALARLRSRFDDPLFARGRTGLVLTPRGADLARAAGEILAIVEQQVLPVQLFDPQVHHRRFRIVIADHAEPLVVATLARLPEQAPRIEVETLPSLTSDGERLASGEIDLVVGTRVRAGGGLRTRRLMTDRLVCLLRRDHPALSGAKLTLEAYLALDHVALVSEAKPRAPIDAALSSRGVERKIAIRLHGAMAMPELLLGSDLAATVPATFAKHVMQTCALESYPVPLPVPCCELFSIWHERTDRDLAHRWLRETIHAGAATPSHCGAHRDQHR